METSSPSYYAVIPAEVRYADIPANAKLLYGEITALTSKEGYCWASNQYFADLYKVNKYTVIEWIRALVEKGFIWTEVTHNNTRKIFIKEWQKHHGGVVKTPRGEWQKHQHINTISTTTKNTSESEIRVVSVSSEQDQERPPKPEKRGKDIEQVLSLFGRPQPWWLHKAQRQAAQRLFDRGVGRLKRGLEIMRENQDDRFCPQADTPFEYETKLPKLNRYIKQHGL